MEELTLEPLVVAPRFGQNLQEVDYQRGRGGFLFNHGFFHIGERNDGPAILIALTFRLQVALLGFSCPVVNIGSIQTPPLSP